MSKWCDCDCCKFFFSCDWPEKIYDDGCECGVPKTEDDSVGHMKGAELMCEGHRCEETGEWVCHKCGGSLAGYMFDPVRDGFVDVPNFCPNCGARVTIGNDTDVPTNEKVVE